MKDKENAKGGCKSPLYVLFWPEYQVLSFHRLDNFLGHFLGIAQ